MTREAAGFPAQRGHRAGDRRGVQVSPRRRGIAERGRQIVAAIVSREPLRRTGPPACGGDAGRRRRSNRSRSERGPSAADDQPEPASDRGRVADRHRQPLRRRSRAAVAGRHRHRPAGRASPIRATSTPSGTLAGGSGRVAGRVADRHRQTLRRRSRAGIDIAPRVGPLRSAPRAPRAEPLPACRNRGFVTTQPYEERSARGVRHAVLRFIKTRGGGLVDRTPRARPRGRSRPNSRQQRDFRRGPRTGRALTSESRSEHPERNPTRSARAAPRNPLGLSRSRCRLGRADHRRPKIRLGAHAAKEARRSRIRSDTASRCRRRQMGCRADRRPGDGRPSRAPPSW